MSRSQISVVGSRPPFDLYQVDRSYIFVRSSLMVGDRGLEVKPFRESRPVSWEEERPPRAIASPAAIRDRRSLPARGPAVVADAGATPPRRAPAKSPPLGPNALLAGEDA
jgi:hypothetical protein